MITLIWCQRQVSPAGESAGLLPCQVQREHEGCSDRSDAEEPGSGCGQDSAHHCLGILCGMHLCNSRDGVAGTVPDAWILNAIVLGECLALAANQGRCPLTPIAARFTSERHRGFTCQGGWRGEIKSCSDRFSWLGCCLFCGGRLVERVYIRGERGRGDGWSDSLLLAMLLINL
jgi:hypothetical protein